MGLNDDNAFFDNRTPVVFRGIKEETLALNQGQSLQDTIERLKDAGTNVSRSEIGQQEESLNKTIEKNQERVDRIRSVSTAEKANGYVNVISFSTTTIPKGTTFSTNDGKEFLSTEEVEINDTNLPFTIRIEAKRGGADYNVAPNTIRNSSFSGLRSVTNVEATSGGKDDTALRAIDERNLESSREKIEEAQRGLSNIESDIEELNDVGILGEGEYTVKFIYDQPNVSVGTTNRFVEHETVDGPVIRQKVGRGKKSITLEGVCTTPEATLLDNFVNEDMIYVKSHRYEGNVSIEGISTSPLSDGGAMNLDGKFTHDFSLELVEIE
jgi:hypothetical protein